MIDKQFLSKHKETLKQMCIDNNIDYYAYLAFVDFELFSYAKDKAKIKVVDNLSFNDLHEVKVALNSASITNKKDAMFIANKQFEESKKNLFNWLDKVNDPYKFILTPVYETNGFYNEKRKCFWTGISAIYIAFDYAEYKKATQKNGLIAN